MYAVPLGWICTLVNDLVTRNMFKASFFLAQAHSVGWGDSETAADFPKMISAC